MAFAALANGRLRREASGETEVGRRLLAPEPRPLPLLAPRTRPAGTQTGPPSWTSDLRGRYFAQNLTIPVVMLATIVATTATLSSNSCKSASFFKTHFPSILWKQFAENDTFLGEVNSYKRALVLRNARQHLSNYSRNTSLRLVETMSRDRFNKQMLPVMHDLADHQYLNYFAMTTY